MDQLVKSLFRTFNFGNDIEWLVIGEKGGGEFVVILHEKFCGGDSSTKSSGPHIR